jgi:hypothetical protein
MPRLVQRFTLVVLPSVGCINVLVDRSTPSPGGRPDAKSIHAGTHALARRDALRPWATQTRNHSNAICTSAKRGTERVSEPPAQIIPFFSERVFRRFNQGSVFSDIFCFCA